MVLLRGLAAIGITLYGVLLIAFGWMMVNLDNKGTGEVAVQSLHEWLIVAYVFSVGALLFSGAYQVLSANERRLKHISLFLIAVLILHGGYSLYRAQGEMIFYLAMCHIPLLVGIISSVALGQRSKSDL